MRMRFEGPPGQGPPWSVDKAMLWAMREVQRRTLNRARELAAVRTGAFRRSMSAEEPEVQGGRITGAVGAGGAGAPYAKAHEYGTGVYSEAEDSKHQPIVIVPVRARALAWPRAGVPVRLTGQITTGVRRKLARGQLSPGEVFVFARRVVQQGQHSHPTLRWAFAESERWVGNVIEEALKRVAP